MAGGMLTKQAVMLTAKFLNDVNDSVSGGIVTGIPAGAPSPQSSQTIPGDRIVLDDATAAALSDPAIGTLFGGIYQYTGTLSTATASPARGTAAFYRAADLPSALAGLYQVTSDVQASTTIPTFCAGVFINAVTKGNFGWIQVAGVCSCLFDSAVAAGNGVGSPVSPKISAAVASTFDCGVAQSADAAGARLAASVVGVAIVLPVISTITTVLWTRSPFVRV
jgi:hypothetical protein